MGFRIRQNDADPTGSGSTTLVPVDNVCTYLGVNKSTLIQSFPARIRSESCFLIKIKKRNSLTVIGFRFICMCINTVVTGMKSKVLLGEIDRIRLLSLLRIGIRITGSRAFAES